MNSVRWLGVCRWVHVLLVIGYVFVTIMILILMLVVYGVRMANGVRWVVLIGWFMLCFGGAILMDWIGLLARLSAGPGCRLPIRSEEERLFALMEDIQERINKMEKIVPKTDTNPNWAFGRPIGFGSEKWIRNETKPQPKYLAHPGKNMRYIIGTDPIKGDRSVGWRTILISSGTLIMASDEELRGILAHELGHLRDGDRILEAAFSCSSLFAGLFRLGWRFVRGGFRSNVAAGLMILVLLSPVMLPLLILFLVYAVSRGMIVLLSKLGDYRQDCFAAHSGCGKGLRDWLVKSGLAANVNRIRRLEKML